MTGYLVAELWCNGCSRKRFDDGDADLDGLRNAAADDGWTEHDDEDLDDLCPDCSDHLAAEEEG